MMSRGLPPPKNSDLLSEYEAEFMHWVLILFDMVALIQSENQAANKGKMAGRYQFRVKLNNLFHWQCRMR